MQWTVAASALVGWVGNPLSMLLAILGKPWAWILVVVTQALFVTFALATHTWQFYGQAACLIMGLYGIYRWRTKGVHLAPKRRGRHHATRSLLPPPIVPEELAVAQAIIEDRARSSFVSDTANPPAATRYDDLSPSDRARIELDAATRLLAEVSCG